MIYFLVAPPSKLSQHFHMLCGFMSIAIASACLHWGVQLTAKERVKDAGPENSTATDSPLIEDRQERGWLGQEIRQIPAWRHQPPQKQRVRGWQRD